MWTPAARPGSLRRGRLAARGSRAFCPGLPAGFCAEFCGNPPGQGTAGLVRAGNRHAVAFPPATGSWIAIGARARPSRPSTRCQLSMLATFARQWGGQAAGSRPRPQLFGQAGGQRHFALLVVLRREARLGAHHHVLAARLRAHVVAGQCRELALPQPGQQQRLPACAARCRAQPGRPVRAACGGRRGAPRWASGRRSRVCAAVPPPLDQPEAGERARTSCCVSEDWRRFSRFCRHSEQSRSRK